jgi:hypothetical protein
MARRFGRLLAQSSPRIESMHPPRLSLCVLGELCGFVFKEIALRARLSVTTCCVIRAVIAVRKPLPQDFSGKGVGRRALVTSGSASGAYGVVPCGLRRRWRYTTCPHVERVVAARRSPQMMRQFREKRQSQTRFRDFGTDCRHGTLPGPQLIRLRPRRRQSRIGPGSSPY